MKFLVMICETPPLYARVRAWPSQATLGSFAVPLFSPTVLCVFANPSVTVVKSPNMSWLNPKLAVSEM